MNKQYRPLEVGETIQEGDEYYSDLTGRWEAIRYHAGYEWKNKTTKARRPISLSTDTEALASNMAGLTDAVADAPSEWSDEVKKSFDDMMLTGTGVMDSGKHVATSDIYLPPEQSKSTDHASDLELPGMWERADFEGGLDESRGPNWNPEPQEQEWNGEGLPPVGFEFELKPYWNRVKVVAHDEREDGTYIVYWDYHIQEYGSCIRPNYFRPIKSTADRNHSELASLIESFSNLSAGIQANHILDWIENDMIKDDE